MKPLLILGAGKFAMEVADLANEIEGFRVRGFVQNVERENHGTKLDGLPVHGVHEIAELAATHWVVCAIGARERRQFIEQVSALGFRFATLVHPTARVSTTSRLAEGTIVSVGCVIASHTSVGRHVILNRGALIGHHTAIGDYVTIGPGANIAGSVVLGEDTFIGIGGIVSDHLEIGARVFIAAGAVITKSVVDDMRVKKTRLTLPT